jgi:hypothetical protein
VVVVVAAAAAAAVVITEGNHLNDPGVDGSIIFKWIFQKWDGCMNWVDLDQYRDRLRALVNAVMSRPVP